MSKLALNNVNKTYFGGYVACQDINFALSSGEVLVVYGTNGAGKSTLLKMISTLETPSSGSITIDDNDIFETKTRDADITFATAELPLMKMRSVRYNLSYPLKIRKEDKAKIDARVMSIAKIFHIDGVLDEAVRYLDKSTKAIVLLARAFMRESKFYLFDNVLSDMGIAERDEALSILSTILPKVKGGVIYATDRLDEVRLLGGNNVLMLSHARQIERGDISQIYDEPSTLDTMRMLSDTHNELVTRVESDNDGKYIELYGKKYIDIDDVYIDKDIIVGVYGEDIRLSANSESNITIERVIRGTREDIIVLDDGKHSIIVSSASRDFRVGDSVDIAIDKMYLFDMVAERRIIWRQ